MPRRNVRKNRTNAGNRRRNTNARKGKTRKMRKGGECGNDSIFKWVMDNPHPL